MPNAELLTMQPVELLTPVAAIVSRPVVRGGLRFCRTRAGAGQTSGSASVSAVAPAFEDRLDRATRSVAAI